MLKLLIVEDEMLVRLGLKTTVDWNSLGFEIVGEAEDGEMALNMAKELRPDLVITDISMPRMDGLELIKALKKELPAAKVLVLSCHKDYEYVREAMQNYGALDYLLKIKLKPEELKEVMLRAKETIETEKRNAGEYLDLRWQVNSNAYDLKGKPLNDLLNAGSSISADILDRLKLMKINMEDSLCIPICFLLDDYRKVCLYQNRINETRLLNFSVLNICSEVIEGSGAAGEVFHRKDSEFGIILMFPKADRVKAESKALYIVRQLLSNYKMFLNVSASFGIGLEFEGAPGFKRAYEAALNAACERFYRGKGGIYKASESIEYSGKFYFNADRERTLRMILEERNENGTWQALNEMLLGMMNERAAAPLPVMEELMEVLNIFSSNIRKYGSNLKEIKDANGYEPYDSMAGCETMQEVSSWFAEFVKRYFAFLDSLNAAKYSNEVNRALEYIEGHFSEDIGLREMAGFLHLNESYFSYIFKKETGINFTDYLNDIRIEKAKEYLRMPGMAVSEVWEKAGYSSMSYFSRVFKQITAMGPAEYKKSFQRK